MCLCACVHPSPSTTSLTPTVSPLTLDPPAPQEGEFAWNEETQGLILGAFFYGYTATNFLGGRLAEYLGGRLVFGLGSSVASVLALLSPLCARISTGLFVASRVLTGVSQVNSDSCFCRGGGGKRKRENGSNRKVGVKERQRYLIA